MNAANQELGGPAGGRSELGRPRLEGEVCILLDTLVVQGDHDPWRIKVPTGVFPLFSTPAPGDPQRIGRLTIVFDQEGFADSSENQLFEPLTNVGGDALIVSGEVAARFGAERPAPEGAALHVEVVDPESGANRVCLRGAFAEAGWWYGGDESRADEGITGLDLILDSRCHPLDQDSPARNLAAVVAAFLKTHGPPSLQ